MEGNSLELTLLRAPSSPQMRADNGIQEFTYAFYAWEGSFTESDVVRQGYELNVQPPVRSGRLPEMDTVSTDRKNIIVDTMKPAEDGSTDVVLSLIHICLHYRLQCIRRLPVTGQTGIPDVYKRQVYLWLHTSNRSLSYSLERCAGLSTKPNCISFLAVSACTSTGKAVFKSL